MEDETGSGRKGNTKSAGIKGESMDVKEERNREVMKKGREAWG